MIQILDKTMPLKRKNEYNNKFLNITKELSEMKKENDMKRKRTKYLWSVVRRAH